MSQIPDGVKNTRRGSRQKRVTLQIPEVGKVRCLVFDTYLEFIPHYQRQHFKISLTACYGLAVKLKDQPLFPDADFTGSPVDADKLTAMAAEVGGVS